MPTLRLGEFASGGFTNNPPRGNDPGGPSIHAYYYGRNEACTGFCFWVWTWGDPTRPDLHFSLEIVGREILGVELHSGTFWDRVVRRRRGAYDWWWRANIGSHFVGGEPRN